MTSESVLANTVSLREEMLAYETLWASEGSTTKRLSGLFEKHEWTTPSRLLHALEAEDMFQSFAELRAEVDTFLRSVRGFTVSMHGAHQHPERLQDAKYPVQLFYYRGHLGLTETPSVSIVGSRNASDIGKARAARLAKLLVAEGYAIVSGLAVGIDTAAMQQAIDSGGRTIGVIGTPITQCYPKENRDLQEEVAREHLLISHVPFYRYEHEPFKARRRYFPERNALMAALSQATVIVEAGDTSGTLTQARAALQQGRKLMILDSCFENPSISWPESYARRGAIRVRDIDDVLEHLDPMTPDSEDA